MSTRTATPPFKAYSQTVQDYGNERRDVSYAQLREQLARCWDLCNSAEGARGEDAMHRMLMHFFEDAGLRYGYPPRTLLHYVLLQAVDGSLEYLEKAHQEVRLAEENK